MGGGGSRLLPSTPCLVRTLDGIRDRRDVGFFAPSCLAHASNLHFDTAPTVRGTRLLDAMRAWYFTANGSAVQYVLDDCGELPCSSEAATTKSQCPRLETVRECHARCRAARRRRRIKNGLDPSAPGRAVCEVDVVAARESRVEAAREQESRKERDSRKGKERARPHRSSRRGRARGRGRRGRTLRDRFPDA